MKTNYVYKKESGNNFISSSSLIELKPYMDDLVFYSPMNDKYRAEYCLNDKIASFETKPEAYTGGPFGTSLKIKDSYKFNINNFDTIKNNIRISFYLGAVDLFLSPSISLKKNENFPEEGLPAGSYSFVVTVDGHTSSTITLNLKDNSTISTIKNKISFKLDPTIYPFELGVSEEDEIVLQSLYLGKSIKVSDGLDGKNLLNYFTIEGENFGVSPMKENTILKLFNISITHFRKFVSNYPTSWLRFTVGENSIEVPWNNNGVDLDNIEFSINDNIAYVFINGKLLKIDILNSKIENNGQTLELGSGISPYSFDEVIVNNECIHTKDFELPKQLTKYSTEKPYIDFYYSNISKGMELKTTTYNNINCLICSNGTFYHWNTGSWRRCSNSFEYSNDFSTFSEKLKLFDFDNDFFVRMFFVSDGLTEAYIDVPYFELVEEYSLEDENGNIPAILIGEEYTPQGDLGELVIITDIGTSTIDFTPTQEEIDKYIQEAGEAEFKHSAEMIVEKINSYYPEGISKCEKDKDGRIILISEIKGSDALINVRGEAAEKIFGCNTFTNGKNKDLGLVNYDKFFDAVRTYTSKLLISEGEVPNEQMKLYLKEALAYYKRYRGDVINQYVCQLKGDWKNGFEIPAVVENQKDITDVIFKPIFPILFYGADFVNEGNDNIFTLTLAQSLFGGRGAMRNAQGITQDYYISLIGMQDFKQTLGLNPTWEVLNNKIFIYPAYVTRYTNVCIKYKAPLSEEECLEDPDIIKYVHGKCLMTMGNTRGQYGADLTIGEASLKFNADSLYERGKAFVDEVIELWKKMQPPMGFFFG